MFSVWVRRRLQFASAKKRSALPKSLCSLLECRCVMKGSTATSGCLCGCKFPCFFGHASRGLRRGLALVGTGHSRHWVSSTARGRGASWLGTALGGSLFLAVWSRGSRGGEERSKEKIRRAGRPSWAITEAIRNTSYHISQASHKPRTAMLATTPQKQLGGARV